MAIPDYQTLMLPVLKVANDGNEHRISDVVDTLAAEFNLTEAEREELLPSRKQATFNNRVHWARTYLAQAKLLEATRRSFFKITDRGRSVLAQNHSTIDAKFLRQFPEFTAFVAGGEKTEQPTAAVPLLEDKVIGGSTPDELLRATISEVEKALASDLVTRICSASPTFFESMVGANRVHLLRLLQVAADSSRLNDGVQIDLHVSRPSIMCRHSARSPSQVYSTLCRA
jgi:restriction system protein